MFRFSEYASFRNNSLGQIISGYRALTRAPVVDPDFSYRCLLELFQHKFKKKLI